MLQAEPQPVPFFHANFDAMPTSLARVGEDSFQLARCARALGVSPPSDAFQRLIDSGVLADMPVEWLDNFESQQLSVLERTRYLLATREAEWSPSCLHAELRACTAYYEASGLCYAPSPRGNFLLPASRGQGKCALILLAAFPNANTKDANWYWDPTTGAYQSCYTWDEWEEWSKAASYPRGQRRFEVGKHISVVLELVQAKCCAQQPGGKEFHVESLLAAKRVDTFTALLDANATVFAQQLPVLKALGCTEVRVLAIGNGKALVPMVEEKLRQACLRLASCAEIMHLSNGWRCLGDLETHGRVADAELCKFTGADSCSYFEERGRRQSGYTTEEARFEHASAKAKRGARTKRAAADASGVTLGSLSSSKFGDADGADPSVAGEAHAHTTSLPHSPPSPRHTLWP